MKIKTGLLAIVLVLLMGCAHLNFGGSYKSFAERYPEAAASMKIPVLGECVEYLDGSIFCLAGEVEVPMPENAAVVDMDKDAVRFIQKIDSDRYDKNLDGEADMYFLLIFLPNLKKYSGYTLHVDEKNMFYTKAWSQIEAEYLRLTGKELKNDWNVREVNIPEKKENKKDTEF